MATLRFGTAKAGRGEKAWGQLTVREGKKSVKLPTFVAHGAKEGEHVVVIANQHGGEINGVESVRRFCEQVDPRRMRGTVFAVASANPRAAMVQNEFWAERDDEYAGYPPGPILDPEFDRNACPYNMNRVWPGRKGGYLVERMVYEIWNRAVMAPHRKASLFLDYHGFTGPSAVFSSNAWNLQLCSATGIGRVINVRSSNQMSISNKACFDSGIAVMTVELGNQYVMDPVSIEEGRRSIPNMLRYWGVLTGKPDYPQWTVLLDPWRNEIEKETYGKEYATPSLMRVKAGRRGLLVPHRAARDWVRKGEVVCDIVDPFTGRIGEQARAPMTGAIYSMRAPAHKPLYACERGDELFAVSCARRVRTADFVATRRPDAYRRDAWGPKPR